MDPLIQGLLWFIPGLIVLIVIALFVFDEDGKLRENFSDLKTSLWQSRGALFLAFLVFIALQIENLIQDLFEPGLRITEEVYALEGVSHIVWLQENLGFSWLIHSFSIFYILGLSFFVAFIPVFFILRNEIDLLEEFSKALAVNYIFLIGGYLLLHLVVTSDYSGDVQAFLYDIPQYEELVLLTNRQTNCFPSGHTSIPLTITLIALFSAKLKRLAIFGAVFTALTIFVIIYLGIHWLIDIPAGIAVAIFAYWVASNGKMDFVFQPIIDSFKKLTSGMIDSF